MILLYNIIVLCYYLDKGQRSRDIFIPIEVKVKTKEVGDYENIQ